MFDLILVNTLNILSFAVVIIITALGLNLIFGLLDVINVAQGSLFILGAYIGYTIASMFNLGFWPALIITPMLLYCIGLFFGHFLVRPIIGMPVTSILFTFGVALSLIEVIKIIWGLLPYSLLIPSELSGLIWTGRFSFPLYRIVIIFIGVLIMVMLWYILKRTNLGMIVRAGLENRKMVEALGINIVNIQSITFALGVTLAGLGGLIAAPIIGVHYPAAWDFLILSFVVVVLGGLGYLPGTIIAGLIVAAANNIISQFSPPAANVAVFIVMFIILAISPRGVLGKGR